MAATRQDVQEWFERGKVDGATHMIVVCDTYDYTDFPVYVQPTEDVRDVERRSGAKDMQRVMEVYCLSKDMTDQLNRRRCFEY